MTETRRNLVQMPVELLQVADAVAREKSIPKELVIVALEDVLKPIAKRKFGRNYELFVKIDRKSGELKVYRQFIVVPTHSERDAMLMEEASELPIEDSYDINGNADEETELRLGRYTPISLEEALNRDSEAQVGDIIPDGQRLPPIDFNRSDVIYAKNLIYSKIKDIIRDRERQEFEPLVGQIVQGLVEKVQQGDLLVRFRGAEGIIRRRNLLKSDNFRQGDRIKAYFAEIDKNSRGPQLILSRTHDNLAILLLKNEVPEIDEGLIEVKAISQDPGSRIKMAVYSRDTSIDPVGSCIGVKACRIQPVSNELNGVKIDVVLWSSDVAQFAINALAPVRVEKLIIDEDRNRIEAVVPAEQQSSAIGRQGQNIRLISQLVGYNISILTDIEEGEKRKQEMDIIIHRFMNSLDIDDVLASLLAYQGYNNVQDLANASRDEMANLIGDEDIAMELILRAQKYLEKGDNTENYEDDGAAATRHHPESRQEVSSFGLENMIHEEKFSVKGKLMDKKNPKFLKNIFSALANSGVAKMHDLADLSSDELGEILDRNDIHLPNEELDKIIMEARNRAYFISNK